MSAKIERRSKLQSRQVFLGIILFLLAIAFVGVFIVQAEEGRAQGNQNQAHQKLIGFVGEYALADDDSLIDVIILLRHNPVAVQLYEAETDGIVLAESCAKELVEGDHLLFMQELASLFSGPGIARGATPYELLWEYRVALNGVNLRIPTNLLEHVASFSSVHSIHPDEKIDIDPLPTPEEFDEASEIAPTALRNPAGMGPGRTTTQANEMHDLGYRGEGVVVAIMDTGIYHRHSVFEGAFLTIEEMRKRGATHLSNADGINIDGQYYYIGRNFFTGPRENPPNDPSEVEPGIPLATFPARSNGTDHGTHVAGTIVARDSGGANAAIGMAPKAKIITYRMLEGTAGATTSGATIAAWEQAVLDQVDVINMSFGGSTGAFTAANFALNNISLADPYLVFVASAGNATNTYYSVASPSNASKAISVANVNIGIRSIGAGTFDANPRNWRMSNFSSRGPIPHTFEIKPDLSAQGSSVFSAIPPWRTGIDGLIPMTGTSMAAPHVAGAATLLIDYSRQNGEQWTAAEIKTRLMNSSMSFGEGSSQNVGVFHAGSGYINVYRAARANTNVSVIYDRVPYGSMQFPLELSRQNLTDTHTGSFSFGNVGVLGQTDTLALLSTPSPNVRTLETVISNNGPESRTYTIDYSFRNNPNSAMTLTLSTRSLTVDPGESANFSATASVGGLLSQGFYEGHIYVHDGDSLVARLPFALVNEAAIQVPAGKLSFNLGEEQAVPDRIDSIKVLEGVGILDFLENYHDGFPSAGPTRNDLSFAGWYLDAEFSQAVTLDTIMPLADVTLHARWSFGGEVQLEAASNHSLFLDEEGILWAWGSNNTGQLGLGDTTNRNIPTQISDEGVSGERWVDVSTSSSHTLALRDDGSFWAWGDSRLLVGNLVAARHLPARVPDENVSGNEWVSISAATNASFALRDDGTLWSWGTASSAGTGASFVHGRLGKVVAAGVEGWKKISSDFHLLAICSNGSLWTWGAAGHEIPGFIGSGHVSTPVRISDEGVSGNNWVYVEAGTSKFFAIRDDGTLWAWGNNIDGELGTGARANRIESPTLVSIDGVSGDRWVSIVSGANQTYAFRDDGSVWTWGLMHNLGTGRNLGSNWITARILTPIELRSPSGDFWAKVSTGHNHTLAVAPEGSLWAWGSGGLGQIGMGYSTQKLVPGEVFWSQDSLNVESSAPASPKDPLPPTEPTVSEMIAVGGEHNLVIDSQGELWVWGRNNSRALGLGDAVDRNIPTQVSTVGISGDRWISVTAGAYGSFAIRDDGTLWSWGRNVRGELGLRNLVDKGAPAKVSTVGISGDRWISVVAGPDHTVALRCDGTLWSWGRGISGQLALGNFVGRSAPTRISVDGTSSWKMLASGGRIASENSRSLAICNSGDLWAWGNNTGGQLGLGDGVDRSAPTKVPAAGISGDKWVYVATSRNASLAIRDDGSLWAWGQNSGGHLGTGGNTSSSRPVMVPTTNVSGTTWTSVTVSEHTVHAIRDDGSLWAWGGTIATGLGSGAIVRGPQRVHLPSGGGDGWKAVFTSGSFSGAGTNHTLAVCSDNLLWAWGIGSSGKLGQGNSVHQPFPVRVDVDLGTP
jgi:alpha-tubulin suppressor-like RCC1 family protein/subtilisin family serine protease